MMHFTYPNADRGQFQACVRFLSLSPARAPDLPYDVANPRTPNTTEIFTAVAELVPERQEQVAQGTTAQVYAIADTPGPWQGASLDLAYLLALIRCSRPCLLEALADAGDVWCTGEVRTTVERQPMLHMVEPAGPSSFDAKLAGFLAQRHDQLFLVPAGNVMATHTDLCQQHQVQVLTLAAFRAALPPALAAGGWRAPSVVLVGSHELPLLSATLFQPAPARAPQPWSPGAGAPRRPYKFLDPFGLTDTGLFCGRDQEIVQLQRQFHGTRLLILYGESGTGKTSLVQAGLLPSLPVERYAWVLVRMVHEEPIAAIKAALVREFGLDRQFLDRSLVDVVTAVTTALGKTVVLVLDQFEEFFLRHDATVRQQFPDELHACLDAPRLPFQVLIAMREEYFTQLATLQEAIPTIFYHTMRLTRFTVEQAREAVVQPARRLGLAIDEAFVQNDFIPQLANAAHIIELPLLQIVCEAWYQQTEEARQATIGHGEYTALGDIRTVLERYLATILRQFGAEQQQAREVLKALVTGDNTSRAVFPDELLSRLHTAGLLLTRQELEQRFLRRLVQARLVRATEVDGQTRYELTHEFLVPQITAWIDASDRDRTKVLEMLARAHEVYQVTGQLLSAQALDMIEPWQAQLVLPEGQQAFLTQSQRAGRRQRVTFWRNVAGAAACLVLVLLAGGGVWYWDAYQREHVDYYAQVITRWGLPEGAGRLTAEQVRQRNSSLAFRKHGRRGPVHEIRLVNSRGTYHPVAFHTALGALALLNPLPEEMVGDRSEIWAVSRVVFERDAQGQILNQIGYNRADRRIYTLHYVQPNMAEYKHEGITLVKRESGIALLKFVRAQHGPEAGLVQEIRFFDSAGTPQPNRDGAYGVRSLFDARGLPVTAIVLGADGQPAVTKAGIASTTTIYDALGNPTQETAFGRDGQAVLNKNGVAGTKLAYDPYGNLQELAFVGTDGQLTTMSHLDVAGRSFRYDAHGNIVESSFFDLHRQPVTGRIGGKMTFARHTVEWDEHGGALETYFGPDGKLIVTQGRIITTRAVWDARGYLVEQAFFDEHKRPVRNVNGCVKLRFMHDNLGHLVEQRCLDERDDLVRSTDGDAYTKWVHDDHGNAIETLFFGPKGQPEHYDERFVKVRLKYNVQGKKVEAAYFDATDQLVKHKEGYAKVTYTYDLQGNLTEVAFFDAQHQPAARQSGYAKLLRTYNERNQLIEETNYDSQGHPTRDEDGYVTARLTYDPRGYKIAIAYFDENTHPTLHKDGYSKVLTNYNDKGQFVEKVFVGLDGAYVPDKETGVAKVRLTYNERGQVAQRMYFDPDERLAQTVYGYATMRYTYDDLGRETMWTFFDVHGDPVHTRAVLEKVEPDSIGAQHGLHVGDILISYDGDDIRDLRTFRELELMKGERPRELRILRQDYELRLQVPPGRLTGLTLRDRIPPSLTKPGL